MIVTWPFTSVVVPAVIVPLMLPPVSVTVAPTIGMPAERDRDGDEPTGIAIGTFVVVPAVTVAAAVPRRSARSWSAVRL